MMSKLENESESVQRVAEILRPVGGGENVSLSTTTAASSNSYTGVVDISCDEDCRVAFGEAAVLATSYKMLSGFTYRFRARGETINGIVAAGTAVLVISPVE